MPGRLLDLLHAAARGAFPPEDGRTEVTCAVEGAAAARGVAVREIEPSSHPRVGMRQARRSGR